MKTELAICSLLAIMLVSLFTGVWLGRGMRVQDEKQYIEKIEIREGVVGVISKNQTQAERSLEKSLEEFTYIERMMGAVKEKADYYLSLAIYYQNQEIIELLKGR